MSAMHSAGFKYDKSRFSNMKRTFAVISAIVTGVIVGAVSIAPAAEAGITLN